MYIASLAGTVHRIDPVTSPPRQGSLPVGDGQGEVDLEQIGGSFDTPVNSAFAPGETNNIYVVEQGGLAHVVVGGATQPDPFLDITDLTDNSGEQGFLSMAFHPDFQSNGLVYAYYTDEDNGDIVVWDFQTNSEVDADEETEREVIRIRHRFATNHNGGHITFGPNDGYLYISTGDGGSGDDPAERAGQGVAPGQADPDRSARVGRRPLHGACRQPLRRQRGRRRDLRHRAPQPLPLQLRLGRRRHHDRRRRGEPLRGGGHPVREFASQGQLRLGPLRGHQRGRTPATRRTGQRGASTTSVLVYNHDHGASVIGGVVVHDEDLTNLYGRYLFTDFYEDRFRSFVPQLTKVDGYEELDTEINGSPPSPRTRSPTRSTSPHEATMRSTASSRQAVTKGAASGFSPESFRGPNVPLVTSGEQRGGFQTRSELCRHTRYNPARSCDDRA